MQGWPVSGTQPHSPECQAFNPRTSPQPFLAGAPGSLTACWAGAVHRGDPEVRGASVEDDGEILWWRANGDGAEVFNLQARKGREQGVCDGVG